MRIIPFSIGLLFTAALIFALDKKWGAVPPLGRFLSPQQGFWQNAEDATGDRSEEIHIPGLKGKVEVYLDERLVPHVFADNNADAYYVQGYLHAKYRLWQMETQTYFAGGRLAEHFGNNLDYINIDRESRRSGMVFAAKNALKEMEADPETKMTCDAYTAGVNAYIRSLTVAALPIEYKLLDYKPEPWSNLKIALFLKQMSRTLADYSPDLVYTMTKPAFSFEELMKLDKQVPDSLVPIVPKGTVFETPGIIPVKPATADSLYFNKKDTAITTAYNVQDPNNGSNNWVVAGNKTKSGAPILCNDPHLELSFPSIWFEMQITTPDLDVYGVSFPGSPNIIIGFNKNIAWGVTNSQRDVKDYFEIRYKDDSRKEYFFNGNWVQTKLEVDTIKIRGASDYYDTVAYTVFGPVLYDRSFAKKIAAGKAIALRWTAHDPSNESSTFYQLNRAKNYDDYLNAICSFSCPGQNFVFASRQGDIALWQQGKFPARWYGQGMYLMPGIDSSYMWQGFIPQSENPHIHADSGFLESANQRAVDSTYPYFIPGSYINARGVAIARALTDMSAITPEDMMRLQNSNYSVFAEAAKPVLLKYVNAQKHNGDARRYLEMFRSWDQNTNANSTGATVYQVWFDSVMSGIWKDEWQRDNFMGWSTKKQQDSFFLKYPDEQTTLEWLIRDSAFTYIDNVSTSVVESITDIVTDALLRATTQLKKEEASDQLEWSRHKSPMMYHLLKEAVMPFARSLPVGGWRNVINAVTKSHGPSWRMIVQMTDEPEAYGVYPGGQSGNPGSPYYDNNVDTWVQGKYFRLWVMKPNETSDKRIVGKLTFTN